MKLTATAVKQAKPKAKDYKLSDGAGMFLLVKSSGGKYWRMKYRFAAKEKLLALGVFPDTSLAQARELREAARKQLASGIDPSEHKRAKKLAQGQAGANSFEVIATEWFGRHMETKSQGYSDRAWRLLKNDLFPSLGRRPISEISAVELLAVLRKVESRGVVETAHRAKQTAGQVFRYAIATGRADRDPTPDLRGALKAPIKSHFSAITTPKEAGKLILAIDGYQGAQVVRSALKLSPLMFPRPGELRRLEWSEVNWDESRVEIPAEKMKMKEPHIIPLSRQALAILEDLAPLTGRHRYVFPSARGASRPLSENGVRVALRTMGYDNETMTPHGFRAMARTILDEVLGFRIEWIEQQLAHAVKDTNGRAYNRTRHLAQRTDMMQQWADYLDRLKIEAANGNIIAGSFPKPISRS